MVQEEHRLGLVSLISFLILDDGNDDDGILLWVRAKALKVMDQVSSAALPFIG